MSEGLRVYKILRCFHETKVHDSVPFGLKCIMGGDSLSKKFKF